MTLTGGNRHDVTQLLPLREAVPPIRGLRGRPRRKPRRLYADRGYDFDEYRRLLWKRGIKPLIARRDVARSSGLGKACWIVERAFAWLHQFKRLRTGHERRAEVHRGLLELACGIICLRRLRTAS
ncbi:putative transposase [Streptomyces noursei]|nr:putative transposase [Streptomyces noursei]